MQKSLISLIEDQDLTPTTTLTEVLIANGVPNAGKLKRWEQEDEVKKILDVIDYTRYLPQDVCLTLKFMTDVLDPVTTAVIPTGEYRLTMRKLLRLSYGQLREQATLMEISSEDLDEVGLAKAILVNYDKTKTVLTNEIARLLLSKELAFFYGIIIRIPPSFSELHLRPYDMINSSLLDKKDILEECMNQGIGVNRKESKDKLSTRLIVEWGRDPSRIRQPFTKNFEAFLTHMWREKGN